MKIKIMHVYLALPENGDPDNVRDLLSDLCDNTPDLLEWAMDKRNSKYYSEAQLFTVDQELEDLFESPRIRKDNL